ncbi:hypothetical protein K2173_003455 [Erythroxylum novogranatense]|uniref:Cyanobacterial aminoacyl-tRNA synthetase CAAD domain-containing protein n=1 Tax=Erythroxylum novogranatense TaxID=1862640 RepID=A0AAV8S8S8_9ROSI|nr:hypothetical protein K2173_003455 [Erythroxylum novogranatense]
MSLFVGGQWDKVEDKYPVSSIAVAGVIVLWGSTGLISAIDRLPWVPGILKLVSIGYIGSYKHSLPKQTTFKHLTGYPSKAKVAHPMHNI